MRLQKLSTDAQTKLIDDLKRKVDTFYRENGAQSVSDREALTESVDGIMTKLTELKRLGGGSFSE